MAARLGLSPGLRLGRESSSQPPSGLAPSVPGVGMPKSRPEERGQTEGVLDPSAGEVEVTPGSQAEAPVPREPSPMPAAQESDPQVAVAAPGQSVSRAPEAPKARMVPKLAARRTSANLRGSRSERPLLRDGSSWPRAGKYLRMSSSWLLICMSRPRLSFPPQQAKPWLDRSGSPESPQDGVGFRSRCRAGPRRSADLLARRSTTGGLGRHQSPWSGFPRPALLSRWPSRWGRWLARTWPRAHRTCRRRWRQLLLRPLPSRSGSDLSPSTLRWPRHQRSVPRRRGRGNAVRPAERQPCPCAAEPREAAPVAPVPDS
jgi:hypothetical protein